MHVREHLIQALRAELVGPYDATGEELLRLAPSRRYLTGFLSPPMVEGEGEPARADGRDDDDDDGELVDPQRADALDGDDGYELGSDKETDDSATPDPEPATRKVFPASVGISVLLPREAKQVRARLRWGEYRLDTIQSESGELSRLTDEGGAQTKPTGTRVWRRVQVECPEVVVELDAALVTRGIPVASGVVLQGRVADAGRGDGTQALALFVVNRRSPEAAAHRDETLLFQLEYQLHCELGFLARPDLTGEGGSDLDDQINDLQYRDEFEYAVGHGVAARAVAGSMRAELGEPGVPRVAAVEIAWIPQAEFKPVAARSDAPVTVSMKELGLLGDAAAVEAALGGLPAAYEAWIETALVGAAQGLSRDRAETLASLVTRARMAAQRIRGGIELLKRDRQVLQAFAYANRAMFFQAKKRGERANEPWAKNPKWRLFQLAFVLLCLDDIANPSAESGHRDEVELIFFPTGGGKTEAYLGLIAFTLLLRRMRGLGTAHGGEGVAVLLRYTLRLLTLDQLERASTLICALETMRCQDRYRVLLGERRFEIGLWVGGKASANTLAQFKEQLTAFRAGIGGHPCPLQSCPWCGKPLTVKSLTVESTTTATERVVVRCHEEGCEFAKAPHSRAGLPLQFVDEQVYRELPCFVVATVDKFAMLPWRGDTGLLFGRATHRDDVCYYGPANPSASIPKAAKPIAGLLPPELIVQDELHLISGPLGTMVGLFETAIEELCTREVEGKRVRPKIIAATATVRRAQRQVQALYGRRETNLFPPQGLDPFETWFSLVEHDKPGRVYVGVAAAGRSMKRVLLRTYLCVLGAAAWAEKVGGASPEDSDGYFTLAGYFNSLRELGGMRRLVEDDIATRARQQEDGLPLDAVAPHKWVARRTIGLPDELTSRESTAGIATIKGRAATPHTEGKGLDVLLASNMISVGVDISRLGVMVVAGQPKTTAEYIQASSRVGRSSKWPGLVVMAYNIYRPRDRSHYEHFVAYHESFYRHVEATSVTPFSAPAIDRGLAALIVALARLLDVDMTGSGEAMNAAGLQAASGRILGAIQRKAANQPAIGAAGEAVGDVFARTVRDRADSLLNCWLSIIDDRKSKLAHLHYSPYDSFRDKGRPLLRNALEAQSPDPEVQEMLTADERRFVAPTSMRDVEPSVHVWRRFKLGAKES
ncbi:Superfamily II DNA and RNA helicase [Enhygromyxa salina]|uniref:Superfamily II DNA and RNA helicase n=1 Tax=Enhygromyxa salina TaxID=215803 RepID=A0A0C2A2K7_9BACT|nr:DISARM system helicase DrmA [Enhygromyxa salina]KIG17618.1 Superfamily II DNA and RNA helicase [Enhygromyxa salina]